jgi:SET domain-containing protein
MVFFKKVELNDLKAKYGFSQQGLIAQEPIKKGERIWHCTCGEKDMSFTRAQLLEIIRKCPKLDYFVRSFSYMIDDDLYAMPVTYAEEKNNDECAFFNHSCNANCGFAEDAFGDCVVAIRDIEPGEELTYHYGTLESESSLIFGLQCKCDSINCCGRLTFDYYRNDEFVEKYFGCMTPYLKQKVSDMKERWYSSKCYVKRNPSAVIDTPVEEWSLSLVALEEIKKDELVARYKDTVSADRHFIKVSAVPNCHLVGNEVFASVDLASETQLTVLI